MKWCDLLFFSAGAGLAAVLWWMRGCPLDGLLILALLAALAAGALAIALRGRKKERESDRS
ncbi:hypothetical protein LJB68_01370 [bacterium 210820-DFI.6.52]|nr:hypothetical protein [bacterium 210820-DFI.6.52]